MPLSCLTHAISTWHVIVGENKQSWQKWCSKEHWRGGMYSLISSAQTDQYKCVALSLQDLGYKRIVSTIPQWQPRLTVLLKHETRCTFLNASRNHTQTFFFSYYSVLSVLYLYLLTFWCDCNSALWINHSCYFEVSGTKWLNFLQLSNVVEDYRWERSACVLITVKDCAFVPFFQTWWIFCWTLLKELCLKKKTDWGARPLLPNPLNISILASHPMPACCWHIDWRTLACLPIILCKQPTVSLSLYLHHFFPPLIFNLSLEGSSQQQVEGGSVWKEVKVGLVLLSVTVYQTCCQKKPLRQASELFYFLSMR